MKLNTFKLRNTILDCLQVVYENRENLLNNPKFSMLIDWYDRNHTIGSWLQESTDFATYVNGKLNADCRLEELLFQLKQHNISSGLSLYELIRYVFPKFDFSVLLE